MSKERKNHRWDVKREKKSQMGYQKREKITGEMSKERKNHRWDVKREKSHRRDVKTQKTFFYLSISRNSIMFCQDANVSMQNTT